MSLDGKGRFWEHTKGKVVLYIPADVYKDSQFPFKAGEHVKVRIDTDNNRLIVDRK